MSRQGARSRRRIRPALVGCLVGAFLAVAMPTLSARSLSSLRQESSRTRSRIKQVQHRLRTIKERQAEAGDELSAAQRKLELARGRLRATEVRLREARAQLKTAQKRLAATRARLDRHTEAMSARILAQYRAGDPSVFEVVLEASDFPDVVNRLEYARRLAAADQRMFTELVETRREQERQEALARRKARQISELAAERRRHAAAVATETRETQRLVAKLRSDRRAAEMALAAEQDALNEIAALIRARTSSGSSYSYSGSWSGSFLMPVSGRITSGFGMRRHPILGYTKMHNGVDIAAPSGTPIRAAASGRVIFAGWRNSWSGYTVIIDHGSGCSTAYCHIRSGGIRCSEGDVVKRGEKIAEVGSTGLSTGPHLHFGCTINGNWVNPLSY